MKILRAALGLLLGLSLASPALGQNTSLTINGTTAADNSATLTVASGATISFVIQNTSNAGRPFGLFGALANTGAPTGWYLATSGIKKPFPVTTGVATSVIEADNGTDIFPDRQSNPAVRLNSTGRATLSFLVPASLTGTFYFQAAVLPFGSSTTDESNAIEVIITAPTHAARMLVSHGTNITGVDSVEFGVLDFNNGTPSSALFTQADPTLANIKVDGIAMGDLQEWSVHSATGADKARDVNWESKTAVGLNNDNHEYARISLPALVGADGLLDTADDIPPRDLLRCYDNVTQEGFFLVINKGANPNTPGVDFYQVSGSRKKDVGNPTVNQWKALTAVSPDGSRFAAIYDDTANNTKMFLIATDGSKPYVDSLSQPTDVVDVTPASTVTLFTKGWIFTQNRLWFIQDPGTNADGDGLSDRALFTVNIRTSAPTPAAVAIPTNANYNAPNAPFIDVVLEKSLLVPRNNPTLVCFVAGDTLNVAGTFPENAQKGDWYVVTEGKPTQAVNLTAFPTFGASLTARMVGVGETYNGQAGYGAVSPDGSRLAFVSIHNNEITGEDDDEVYVVSTADTNGDNLGDDAGLVFTSQITRNAIIDSNGETKKLDNAHDIYLSSGNDVYFWYGVQTSTTDMAMDLFHWRISTQTLTNVTRTGDTTVPITTKGTILPEGHFYSPNGRYLYFSRGKAIVSATNLAGVDTQTDAVFNVTGNEFPGAKTVVTSNTGTYGENWSYHLSFAGGASPSLCYFSLANDTFSGYNPWVFDANFPTIGIQLTSVNTANNTVQSLTGSPVSMGCAWGWCLGATSATDTLNSDVQYQDLLYFFRDDLTQTANTASFPLSAITFVRPGTSSDASGAAPPAIVIGLGDTTPADNPTDAELYYFSLDGTTNYDFDSVAGVDAPGHQVGTLTGILQVYFASVP